MEYLKKGIEYILPELKESEDERIRKELLEHCKNQAKPYIQTGNKCPQIQSWIAWLEKQGKNESDPRYKCLEELLEADTIYQMAMNNVMVEEAKTKAMTALSELEIGKLLEIEKQAEQKKELLQELDDKLNNALENETSESLGKFLNEQKSANKVEPKFHKGDWIVISTSNDRKIVHIVSIEYFPSGQPRYITSEGKWLGNGIKAHLWNITKDAKDGDVLINWNNTTFIFKAIEDETVKFHIAYNENWDAIKTPSNKLSHLGLPEPQFEFHPATKEQRDALEKAMADAGYTFDFEKKELKKIVNEEQIKKNLQDNNFRRMFEKNHDWSEEDEQYLLVCKNALAKYQVSDKWDATIISQWLENRLKSLKDRVQPKVEWGEEDERLFQIVIDVLDRANHLGNISRTDLIACVRKLKSLRPHKQWKPSEEQLKSLEEVIDTGYFTSYPFALETLFKDLKKLKS